MSKNGNLLLNIGPRADGTIPTQIQTVLLQMGAWLRVNGEAIYGTRPWVLYGEGTTNARASGHEAGQTYTPADIRFTQKDGTLYAMGLAWPRDGKVLVKTLYRGTPYLSAPIQQVTLLGDSVQ